MTSSSFSGFGKVANFASFAGNGKVAKIGKTASRSSHLAHVLNRSAPQGNPGQ
jgi:hypothetical protein